MNSVYNDVSSIDEHANHTPSGEGENSVETGYDPQASAAQLSQDQDSTTSQNGEGYDQDSTVSPSDEGYDQNSNTSNTDVEYDQDSSKDNDLLRHQISELQRANRALKHENIELKTQLKSSQKLGQSYKFARDKFFTLSNTNGTK